MFRKEIYLQRKKPLFQRSEFFMKYEKVKRRAFEIIEKSRDGDKASTFFDRFIIILICINVISIFIETFSITNEAATVFRWIEIVSVILFTIEYILRVWTAPFLYPELSKSKATIKYIFSFMALIDLLAILPFYFPFFISIDLRILRALRLIRLFRLFKMNRYTNALTTVLNVIKNKASELISSIFVVFILMLISSVFMYTIESPVQPEIFKNGFSGLWWAVATFTTVGYGDIYPITTPGRILSMIMAVLGIALVAVPTGIISSGFIELNEKDSEKKHFCPYCGKKLD